MTALDDTRRRQLDDALPDESTVESDVEESVDEVVVLEEEIERLRQRVVDLELTVTEYRNQMSQVLSSASWKMTSPIRATASRYRTAKVKAKRTAKRIKHGSTSSDHKVLTAGLFMPDLTTLPEGSPLRRKIDVNTLRRPPEADGPLTRPEGEPRILVVAHVHYPELWADIDDRLVRMPEDYDLIVTVTEGSAETAIPRIMSRHPKARIEVVPNKGRDWAPLVRLANKGLLSGYDAVAKVHTKKSEHRIDGDGWRIALLDGVFESPAQIRKTIDLLQEDRSVGLVVPTGHVAGTEHWGSNQGIVEALAYRLPMAFDPDLLKFPAGSMFWCRPWLLERLADLDINDEHFEPEAGQYDATTAHALERLIGIFSQVGGMDIVESMAVSRRLRDYRKNPVQRPNIYAFYLPQYHQCPENDEFWGEGFTDWVNVKKAKPLFEGHRQPILPSEEVGFYDLKDPEVLRKQAKMAKVHGIDGFIFHYYWFDGKKVLDTPLNNWLADPTIDMPLALCWANEPWTRRWDGLENDVLIHQTYGVDWASRFWNSILPFLQDERYLTVDGAPMLVIYRSGLMPDPASAFAHWRQLALDESFQRIHLTIVDRSRDTCGPEPSALKLADEVISFPPGSGVELQALSAPGLSLRVGADQLLSYGSAFRAPAHVLFPGWDNTARRGAEGYTFFGSSACPWAGNLRLSFGSDRLYVNAWNEWAEGAALEPSLPSGRALLSTIRDVWQVASRIQPTGVE
ncbi:MAG TPA: hypothetical protein DCQ36_03395 [Actinobacteria bacterium]|nr:hypothetical protein [Actinomycetota bacterium]